MKVNGKTGERELVCREHTWRWLKMLADMFDDLKGLSDDDLFKVDEYVLRFPNRQRIYGMSVLFKRCLRDCNMLTDSVGNQRVLYSLRHSYVTFSLLHGVPAPIVANQIGSSLQMIQTNYSHLLPSLSAGLLSGIDKLNVSNEL